MKRRCVVGLILIGMSAWAQGGPAPPVPPSQPAPREPAPREPAPRGPIEDPNAPQPKPDAPIPPQRNPVPDPNRPIQDPTSPGMPRPVAPVLPGSVPSLYLSISAPNLRPSAVKGFDFSLNPVLRSQEFYPVLSIT